MISDEKKQEIIGMYDGDATTYEISAKVKVSEPTICKILKRDGYPKCRRCGLIMKGKRLSTRYCETCRRLVSTKAVMDSYKKKRLLQLPIDMEGNLLNLSMGELSTHGDIYGINIGSLGTGNLTGHYKNREDEYNAIMREHSRIFGGGRDQGEGSFLRY